MSKPPVFHLTRRAALDLRDIYNRSRREWSEATASRYITDLYAAMNLTVTHKYFLLSRICRAKVALKASISIF